MGLICTNLANELGHHLAGVFMVRPGEARVFAEDV
jgi:hypothetical protein